MHINGHLAPGDVAAFLDYMYVLVVPYQPVVQVAGAGGQNSVQWVSPIEIFEYMQAANPIVASDLSAIREVMSERNAQLCQVDEPGDRAAVLDRLAGYSGLRRQSVPTARPDFGQYYRYAARIERIIETCTFTSPCAGAH